jgi:signal transduction histidine kinase
LLAAVLEAAFALLLVALVWVVARSIVAPLRRLVAAAERIRGGDLGVEVEIDRPDELGDLGRTFNQMSQELRGSAHRIQELHDQEMRRAAQLASVGELASGIAHEIKNPLVGVASGLDLLAGQIGDNPKAEGFLRQMRAQLDRIESAIRDLLSYARPRQPRLAWTQPGLLVDRVVQLITPQTKAAGVRIETSIREAVPKIRVDPDLVAQALVNLALNGIQVMAPGGVLTISTDHVNDEVHIAISDTGTGIPGEQLEAIFRPFYTTKHQGTGLGLAISRGIVERHGGRLEVESDVGTGSTFTLVFSAPQGELVTQ